MKVFFDNCTSPTLAATLNGFIMASGDSAHHIADLPCGRSAPDEVWMRMLADSTDAWLVITGDGRIYRNKAQRAAYRQATLKGFVLAPT